MSVVARFYVSETKRSAHDPGALSVTLQAVSRGEENKVWAQYTPSGQLTMAVKAGPAADFFGARLGQDIAVTFDAVEDETAYKSPHQG